MPKKLKIAIIPTIIAPYRKGFYDRLLSRDDLDITIYCQTRLQGSDLLSISEEYKNNIRYVKFISTKSGNFSWQFLPFRKIIKSYDVIFLSGNPRVLSDFVFGIVLRIIGKPVVLWSMAKSYRGNKFTERLRLQWARIFNYILLYTEYEIKYLKSIGFRTQQLFSINNGLDQKSIEENILKWDVDRLNDWKIANSLENKISILSLARLEAKNNFDLVLNALPTIAKTIPNIHWVIVGSGKEESNLRKLCQKLNLEKYVTFAGAIFQEELLAPYFMSSIIFVHPAAIGLSLFHAFGYGLPVVTHDINELHGPEFGVFENGITGNTYTYGDHESLANAILKLIKSDKERGIIETTIKNIACNKYNVDIMVNRFVEISKLVKKNEIEGR
jgi:glycosyltransferase involved in cell wall biosynthesis